MRKATTAFKPSQSIHCSFLIIVVSTVLAFDSPSRAQTTQPLEILGESELAYIGTSPVGPLLQLPDNLFGGQPTFWGICSAGGRNGGGTVFSVTSMAAVAHFDAPDSVGPNGSQPNGGLVLGNDGALYGTTLKGGQYNKGTIFRYAFPRGPFETLGLANVVSFNDTVGWPSQQNSGPPPRASGNGAYPKAALVKGNDGALYGTTYAGGSLSRAWLPDGGQDLAEYRSFGTVFRLTTGVTPQMATLLRFSPNFATTASAIKGQYPSAALVAGTDGNLYGTTEDGGSSSKGIVFRINASGIASTIASFPPLNQNSGSVYGALGAGLADGRFYGTTKNGNTKNSFSSGTAFQVTSSGNVITTASFGEPNNNGLSPTGGLVMGSDGNFYGTTSAGGANGMGTLFKMTREGAISTLYSFDTTTGGRSTPPVFGKDGKLYGMTSTSTTMKSWRFSLPPPPPITTVVKSWGNNWRADKVTPSKPQPAELSGVLAIASGFGHTLALKNNGTVVGWGTNNFGQLDVPTAPQGKTVTAISAAGYRSAALLSDGTVMEWGSPVPTPPVYSNTKAKPEALTGVSAISISNSHTVVLQGNPGTIVAWGANDGGQLNVPAGLGSVTAIAAGDGYTLALKTDGTVVGWGYNNRGKQIPVAAQSGVKAIAACGFNAVALKTDGTVINWGGGSTDPTTGQSPNSVPQELTGVQAIAPGDNHTVALMADGTVVAWGYNVNGEVSPLSPQMAGATVTAVASGNTFTSVVLSTVAFQNGNFAAPALGANPYLYNPISAQWWTFAGNSGLSKVGAGLGFGVADPTYGQYAFLQTGPGQGTGLPGRISQTVTFPAPGSYELGYMVAGRIPGAGYGGAARYLVTISGSSGGDPLLSFPDTATDGQPFTAKSRTFTVLTAGSYTLTFANTGPTTGVADATVLIDNVKLFLAPSLAQ